MATNEQIAQAVFDAVGGADSISYVTHCMTRLRFNLRDESGINDDDVKALDGVCEQTIYGVCFKYPRAWAGAIAGGFIDGLWMGITHTGVINPGASSVFGLLGYMSAEQPDNFMNVCIAATLAFVISFVVSFLVGFKKTDQEAETVADA